MLYTQEIVSKTISKGFRYMAKFSSPHDLPEEIEIRPYPRHMAKFSSPQGVH